MDELKTLLDTFFDADSMWQALPDMLMTGLPNTLILSAISGLIGRSSECSWPWRASPGPDG